MKEYLTEIPQVFKALGSSEQGLTSDEAKKRLEEYGPNKLKEGKKDSLIKKFFKQMADPMIIILIVAKLLDKFQTNRFVIGGFKWLRPASTALIASAGLNVLLVVFFDAEKITFDMFGSLGQIFTHINWVAVLMFAGLFLVMKTFKGHPLIFILISAGLGSILKL